MKKLNFLLVLTILTLVTLTACTSPSAKSKDTATTKAKDSVESSEIVIDEPYRPKAGLVKADKDAEAISIGDINYSITKVTKVDGANDKKLAIIYYQVTNETEKEITPNEFWFRYVKVTQSSDEPLAVGALPYEQRNSKDGKLIQKVNQPLKAKGSAKGAITYVLGNDEDIKVTFLNTEYQEITTKNYTIK